MTLDEIRGALFAAAKLRIPRFEERDTTGMRIEKIETYMLTVAHTRGDLEEGRLYVQQVIHGLDDQWSKVQGWEMHLPIRVGSSKAATQAQITAAKRILEPDLYDQIRECKFLIARLTEQINRLSHMGDDQVASRVYTLMAGS